MSLYFFESTVNLPAKMVILPVRSTVIKTSRGVIVISPINFTPQDCQQIEALGPVTDIVAPSLLHHLFLAQASKHFKNATIWGPMGSKEKLTNINWQKVLGQDSWNHADEVEILPLQGMPELNEVIFFHKPTKSLIVTDLIFNLQQPKGWAASIILRLLGTYKKLGVSKLILKYVNDVEALKKSLYMMLDWDFHQVIMAHGSIVTTDGKNKLIESLRLRHLI